jgi:hypothetical protein
MAQKNNQDKLPFKVKEDFNFDSGQQGDNWVQAKVIVPPPNVKVKRIKLVINWKD